MSNSRRQNNDLKGQSDAVTLTITAEFPLQGFKMAVVMCGIALGLAILLVVAYVYLSAK